MERSQTMENMEILNGTVPNNRKKWDTGMEPSRTMEKVGYGNKTVPKNMEIWNGTVPNNGEYENLEWNGPEQ